MPDDLSALLDEDQDGVDRQEQRPADPVVAVDVPGLITEHLAHVENDAVRRGQGYSVRVTAPVSVHVAKTEHSASALTQSPAGRKAHRIHADRVETARAS